MFKTIFKFLFAFSKYFNTKQHQHLGKKGYQIFYFERDLAKRIAGMGCQKIYNIVQILLNFDIVNNIKE